GRDRISTAEYLAELIAMSDAPWKEYKRGRELSARDFADLLRPYKIYPTTIWIDGRQSKGYYTADFHDAFSRYLNLSGSPGNGVSSAGTGSAVCQSAPIQNW